MKLSISKRRLKEIVAPIVIIYVLLHIFLFANYSHFLYSPDTNRSTPAAVGVPDMQVITVKPADMPASIEGWYKAPAQPGKLVVVIFHGDGGGIAARAPLANMFMRQGYGVLLAEYRGYSTNPGTPREKGLVADGEAYLDWLINHEGIREGQIVLYGESLGSGVAVPLAAKHLNVAGMILDGSFTSLTALNQRSMPGIILPLVMPDHYDNLARIANVTCPILFIHGWMDNVVPYGMAQKLYDTANQPKVIMVYPKGGHGNLYSYGATKDVMIFLQALERT